MTRAARATAHARNSLPTIIVGAIVLPIALAGCTIYQDQPPATPAAAAPQSSAPVAYADPGQPVPAAAPPAATYGAPPAYEVPPETTYAPPPAAPGREVHVGHPVASPTPGAFAPDVIRILSATYGANCRAAPGNATENIAGACNGQNRCDYRIDYRLLGDPAPGCQKDYAVEWTCGGQVFRAGAGPEAGWGDKLVQLTCAGPAETPVAVPAPAAPAAPAPLPPPPAPVAKVGIEVSWATYGGNCGVARGNATSHVAQQCNGQVRCDYRIDHRKLGDPAHGCQKDFVVEWRCNGRPFTTSASAEAGWGDKSVTLSCESAYTGPVSRPVPPTNVAPVQATAPSIIQVVSATFGGNCRAPQGNATDHVAHQCNGQSRCDYRIDYRQLGDPARGCQKDFVVDWRCSGSGRQASASASPEAGWGDQSLTLSCP